MLKGSLTVMFFVTLVHLGRCIHFCIPSRPLVKLEVSVVADTTTVITILQIRLGLYACGFTEHLWFNERDVSPLHLVQSKKALCSLEDIYKIVQSPCVEG